MGVIRSVSELHPKFQPIVQQWLSLVETDGINILITETRRTLEVQKAYWASGRKAYEEVVALYKAAGLAKPSAAQAKKVITQVGPGFGWHPYGLAVDFVPMVNGVPDWKYDPEDPADYYDEIARHATSLGMIWGGSFRTFKDRPHVEWHPGYTKSAEARQIALKNGDWRIPIPKSV